MRRRHRGDANTPAVPRSRQGAAGGGGGGGVRPGRRDPSEVRRYTTESDTEHEAEHQGDGRERSASWCSSLFEPTMIDAANKSYRDPSSASVVQQ